MQTYKSTRKVRAAKITAISALADGVVLFLDHEAGESASVTVHYSYVRKHAPAPGGYYVSYGDGYESFCPAEAFERDHQVDDGKERGLPVSGYKPQSPVAIDCVNAMKHREEQILRQLDHMMADPEVDERWLTIGRTGLEQAFMAINRAIFCPSRVTFPSDTPRDAAGE